MKIKLDENIPATLANRLTDIGHDVDTVPQEGLTGKPDEQVWYEAQQAQRFFITQDLDFSDLRQYQPGTHYGLLLVRLSNPSRKQLITFIENKFKQEDVETWQSCFVVATERKIRVKRS